jgi:hypothetical protein
VVSRKKGRERGKKTENFLSFGELWRKERWVERKEEIEKQKKKKRKVFTDCERKVERQLRQVFVLRHCACREQADDDEQRVHFRARKREQKLKVSVLRKLD